MLTHVHKVKHLVVSTFEQGLKRWRGVWVSLSLSRRASSVGFGTFENEMHIFYCTDGKFGEVTGVFFKHSLDTDSRSIERWASVGHVLTECVLEFLVLAL